MKRMMIRNSFGIIFLCLASFCLFSCNDSATDGYNEITFLENGKVSNLRTYVGFQRVTLAWDNPTDASFIRNQIIYRTKDGLFGTIVTEKLVDNIVVDNLYSDNEYEFEIYTLDKHDNYSKPLKKRAKPISEAYFTNSLTVPGCKLVFNETNDTHEISWSGLSDDKMFFAGEISYKITAGEFSQKYGKRKLFNIEYLNDIENMKRYETNVTTLDKLEIGVEYEINYSINIWVISEGQNHYLSNDVIQISGSAKGIVPH